MITRENVADLYPLTPFQEGLLYQELREEAANRGGERANQLQVRFRLAGPLDVEAFGRAWQALVDRHDVLRTAFPRTFRDRPLQVVARHVPFVLEREEMDGLALAEREAVLAARAQRRRSQPLGLDQPPLMRALCVRFDGDDHGIVWDFHHILLDGWCIGTLQKDLADLYRAAVRGMPPRPNAGLRFARYVQWHDKRRAESEPSRWASLLAAHEPAAPYLPGRRAGAPVLARAPACHAIQLPSRVADGLRGLARSQQCTLSDALHALWGAFLTRLNHSHDILFGSVRAARPADLEGVDAMVGPSIGMFPVRVACRGHESLTDVLLALKPQRQLWAEQPVDALPDILAAAGLTPSAIDHFLVVENFPLAAAYEHERQPFANGLELWGFRFESANDYDFYVRATPSPTSGIRIEFEHDANAFEPGAIRALAARFARFADEASWSPWRAISQIDLLSAKEKAIARTLAPGAAPDRRSEFASCWADLVWTYGDQPALRWRDRTFTYRALHEAAAGTARRLIDAGATDGDVVAVPAIPEPAMIQAMLACHLAGLPYLPVDPQWPAAHRTAVLHDSGARWLLGDVPPQWGDLAAVKAVSQGPGPGQTPATVPAGGTPWPTPVGHSGTAYVIYTSGTTGAPKGVAVGMGSLLNYVSWTREALGTGPGSSSALLTSAAYDLGYTAVFGTLFTGGCLRLLDDDERRDPETVVRCVIDDRLTFLKATPSYFAMLWASEAWRALRAEQHCLRQVLLGGEAQDFDLLRSFHAAHPQVTVWNHYGPTEATIGCIAAPLTDLIEGGMTVQRLGRPIPGADVVVCDQDLQPLPPGVVGEILLGGAILAQGYLGAAAASADRFVALPAQDGRRFYRTGDFAEWTLAGEIVYHGRRDDQVKVQGYRTSLAVIATAVRGLPGVADAAVLLQGGGQQQTLLAFVVLHDGAQVRAVDWRETLSHRLPRALAPGRFVAVPAIPLTPNGKLDRKALLLAAERSAAAQAVSQVTPASPLEARICAVFSEVLDVDRVGPDDDFYALGGHSLKAIRLGSVLRRSVDRAMPLLAVLEHPTPRALARHLQALSAPPADERLLDVLRESGTGAAEILFFPTLLGTPTLFQGVADRMTSAARCWGLRCPATTPESLDRLGARMADEIRRAAQGWTERPLVLVGWSFGAYVACETARHLASDTTPRPMTLVLIDIPPRMDPITATPWTADIPPAFEQAVRQHLGPDLGTSDIEELVRMAYRHARLIDGYRLQAPVGCDILGIEAAAAEEQAGMHRWADWSLGRCTHVSLPADHHGIVAPAMHATLADLIDTHASLAQPCEAPAR